MWHPLDSLPRFWRRLLTSGLIVGVFAFFYFLNRYDEDIRGENDEQISVENKESSANFFLRAAGVKPGKECTCLGRDKQENRLGIVDFELAGSVKEAQCIVDSWEGAGVLDDGRRCVQLDFAFIVCYSLLFSYLWIRVARGFCHVRTRLTALKLSYESRFACAFMYLGMFFSYGQWMAGLLDVVENCSLLYMLDERVMHPLPWIAAAAAYVKFYLVMVLSGPLFVVSLLVLVWLYVKWWLKRQEASFAIDTR